LLPLSLSLLFSLALAACGGGGGDGGGEAPAPSSASGRSGSLGGTVTNASSTRTVETLVYANDQKLEIIRDLVFDSQVDPHTLRPAALLIHGGGWESGDRTELRSLSYWLARTGFVPIAIDYRLTSQGHTWPAQAEDAEQAMFWIREHAEALGIDPQRVVVIGSSAGGHLAGWLATHHQVNARGTSSQPNRVVSLWGPWNLSTSRAGTNLEGQRLIDKLMGGLDPRVASPELSISAATVPALFIQGSVDTLVPPSQATSACAVLRQSGSACELLMLDGEGHGPAIERSSNLILNTIGAFIEGLK
jgi:acetyl esterase/lipase